MEAAPSVFISYAHRDAAHKDEIVKHLRALHHRLELTPWSDDQIQVGSPYRDEILAALNAASVAILLVSVDALNSEFIRAVELPRLLERRRATGMLLIPVLVRPCTWRHISWLEALQMANAKPLVGLSESDREDVLARLAERVGRHVIALRGEQPPTIDGPSGEAVSARPDRARPAPNPRNVDREAELATFLSLFAPETPERVLVVDGSGSMGKTWFLQKCRVHQPPDSTAAWIDFKDLGASIVEIILHVAESWERHGTRFPLTMQMLDRLLGAPAADPTLAERRLTKSLLDEARQSRFPGSFDTITIDHLEYASSSTRGWVVTVLLPAVVRDDGLALVVAGQRTADVAVAHPTGVAYHELRPLKRVDAAALAATHGLDLRPDDLDLLYDAANGNPLYLDTSFDNLRRKAAEAGAGP